MQMLSCQTCGAPVHWDGASRIAVCAHCGTEYLMHPQSREDTLADGVGRDEVAVIPICEGAHAGRAYARSFIPKGWTVKAANPELTSSLVSPLTMRARYTSDDGRAIVSRTGCVAYDHIDDTPANAARQWSLEMPSCKRVASYRDAPAICDMTVGEQGASVQLIAEETDEDDAVKRLLEKMRANVAGGNVADWNYSYCRRTYRVIRADGTPRQRSVEALVDYVAIPPDPAEVQLFQQAQSIVARTSLGGLGALGSLFGLGGGVPGLERPQVRYVWEIAFMVEVDALPDAFDVASGAARLIRASYEESPLFERTKAEMSERVVQAQIQQSQAVNNAMSQMARDNAAHWDRMNDIVRSTNDYTTGVMHDMFASNAASHDRVANLNSEMLREVNTYHANGGVVEASTSWDHVYQSGEHPDWFVATEGFELRPGIDFEELPRTQGDY